MAKFLLVSFLPFAERPTNGGTTVATRLKTVLEAGNQDDVHHEVLPVEWAAVGDFKPDLSEYDVVIGLGEGFDHIVAVERYAYRSANDKDATDSDPAKEYWMPGEAYLRSGVQLGEIPQVVGNELLLPHPEKVVFGSNPGAYLCNALYYRLLQLSGTTKLCFFVYLPPEGKWMETNSLSSEEYGRRFGAAVLHVLRQNEFF